MDFYCCYDDEDGFGYTLVFDAKYDESCSIYEKKRYYDIVLDYLNHDIESLACCGTLVAHYRERLNTLSELLARFRRDDEEEIRTQIMMIKDLFPNAPESLINEKIAANREIFEEIESRDYPELNEEIASLKELLLPYEESLKEIEKQLSATPTELIADIVKYVLLDDGSRFSMLSNRSKYIAYLRAYGGSERLRYSLTVNFGEDVDEVTDEPVRLGVRKKEDVFLKVCEMQEKNIFPYIPLITHIFHHISDMILFFLNEMVKRNCKVKMCPNCGRYFVPQNRSDEIYCKNISPQDSDKTCQEYAKYINYLTKSRTDEATKLYKQIYNAKANRFKRSGNRVIKSDLDAFREKAKQWRNDIKNGTALEADYILWLKAVKAGEE